ncbi:hypothetical protein BHE90_015024 [Fusarium euwallaceae]|uniref:Uncharacterized protein n=1 Tax=Fusarium euwallaceae TaxID=1147111 RepID=A0A430L4B8_9HYPO|nr:hypothetical protein BHE90_015024 [Fusarium euwallaceae]
MVLVKHPGEALTQAQRQYHDTGAYGRREQKRLTREPRRLRRANCRPRTTSIPSSPEFVLERNAVLALHEYLLSHKYRSSRFSGIAISASPEMSISKLYEAAEHVDKQMNKTSGGSQNEQNLDNLELATDDEEENIFPLAWKD